ncbi:MAG: IPExxxVDY family protein [Bacteroidales bacterium]|nr:IPExxxVDY family protein [Bacteroidales bacterium]
MTIKKNSISVVPFDDITLLAIVTQMSDFTLAWNLNNAIGLNLKKMDNIVDETVDFSFYYFDAGENKNVFNLVQLVNNGKKLLKLGNPFDYLLIIRHGIHEHRLTEWIGTIRKIKGISVVSQLNLDHKEMDSFLEKVEFHEFKQIRESAPTRLRTGLQL